MSHDTYVVARVREEFRERLKEHVTRGGVYMSLSDFARRALEEKFQRDCESQLVRAKK